MLWLARRWRSYPSGVRQLQIRCRVCQSIADCIVVVITSILYYIIVLLQSGNRFKIAELGKFVHAILVHMCRFKLRLPGHKGRNSTVKSSQLIWARQFKKCIQDDFKFTSVYIELSMNYNFFSFIVFLFSFNSDLGVSHTYFHSANFKLIRN